ncbi:MAG: type I-MYXAN CRISPR-associated protein Cas6/Cmx6 [Planctomycetia bacterium]|nr:type I-MYXAN CRISPR-associated protein Cas6/Cmx6 [Planctomycetia bacterium]
MYVDLAFRLQTAGSIPADHGYALYSGVSRFLPELHQEIGVAIHPICGRQIGDRRLALMPWSALTIRAPADRIATLLRLAGKSIRINDAAVRVGVPEVRALAPSTALRSRLVVIKIAHAGAADLTNAVFIAATRKQMDDLGIGANAVLNVGKRRTLRLKQREIVGYELLVEGLTPSASLDLQASGLGGKRHMGCGVFMGVGEPAT